ncbi:4Fe-4S ferredoxin [candidate division LCP-89 bacterium B3_LCP]|uniref:4Fe-4S ferredoxin n=1 Tax=candidate division LCP-89 bacterium B3_LCP TaxID=2012998 RepID=A0A532UU89_UNCL8|nr:MAG: 4Fe-4S ferredoxin [candidate division LCP-89 bacterium B3_LCP]
MDRRDFVKTAGGSILLAASSAYAFQFLTSSSASWMKLEVPSTGRKWGMVINLDRCQENCTACLDACRHENNVALSGDERWDIHWIRKVRIEGKIGSKTTEKSVILLCNHCDNPPCAQVCPVQATYKRDDGIVIIDHHRCIGCRYCMIACPYNARCFNFKDTEEWPNKERPRRSHGVAESCHLCAHRLDVGKMPACVEACQRVGAEALFVGDMNDPASNVSELITNNAVKRLKEDLGTAPKVHYIGL